MARQTKELEEYARKRDFKATPEPSAAKGLASAAKRRRSASLRFVIQKHRATRLHYDFRLEVNGVLASWAVPKGPSLDPDDKRLAMHVEDHPFDYRDFEGIIPKGQYGAGEVIVWDEGTYELAEGDDPAREVAQGKIKFILHGEKLHGEFTLVKIKARSGESGDPWLLVKDKDQYVDVKWRVEDHPKSVQSGADISQIAKGKNVKEWQSDRKAASAKHPVSRPQMKLPTDVSPMLATPVDHPFDDDKWLFELKWDGFRATAAIDSDGNVELKSRNGKDLLAKFPELTQIGQAFSTLPIIVDGEIVSLDANGTSSFQRLQNMIESVRTKGRSRAEVLTYVVFDLLFADGRDLRNEPLEARKQLLEHILESGHGVMLSKHVIGNGKELFALAKQQQLEGIIGKRRDSKYVGRRSRDWVKVKAVCEQEFVIGGWTDPRGSRSGFGALLLGVYEGKDLQYAGRVGTGFDARKLQLISKLLKPLETKRSPFTELPVAEAHSHFVRPELVAEVRFTEWTDDGILRHPAFLGLRDDKSAKEIVRENALPSEELEVTKRKRR